MNIWQFILMMSLVEVLNAQENGEEEKIDKFNISLGFKVNYDNGIPSLLFQEKEEPRRRNSMDHQNFSKSTEEESKIGIESNKKNTENSVEDGFWEPNVDLIKSKEKSKISETSDVSLEEVLKSEVDTKAENSSKVNLRKHLSVSNKDFSYETSDSSEETAVIAPETTVKHTQTTAKPTSKSLKSIFRDYALNKLRNLRKAMNFTKVNAQKLNQNNTEKKNYETKATLASLGRKDSFKKIQSSGQYTLESKEISLESPATHDEEDKTDVEMINLKSNSESDRDGDLRSPRNLRKDFNRDTRENIDDYGENFPKFRGESDTLSDTHASQDDRKEHVSKENSEEPDETYFVM